LYEVEVRSDGFRPFTSIARVEPDALHVGRPAHRERTTRADEDGAGRAAAERIAAVIACTAFESGDGKTPFTVDFDIGVAQIEPGENAAVALERAAARAQQREAS
jgi:two-component system cell cycle response regulator PopA